MTKQRTVLGIAGSLREASYNRALLKTAQALSPEHLTIQIYALDDIPLFNEDLEALGDPAAVKDFKTAIAQSDALLMATPEYQHGLPGVLKNALDWASRPPNDSVLNDKPAAIMGATVGFYGTARAQEQLRQTLTYAQVHTLTHPEVLISDAKTKFTDGELKDNESKRYLQQLLDNLDGWIRRLNP